VAWPGTARSGLRPDIEVTPVLHLRILSPPALTDAVVEAATIESGVANVVVQRGVGADPASDLVSCDLARSAANRFVDRLQDLGIDRPGALTFSETEWVEARPDAALQAAGGSDADAVIWEQVARRAHDDAQLTRGYATLMGLAGVLATIAILTNNGVLVVGAMIVSPDFGPTAGLAVALITRRRDRARVSATALLVGFAIAALAAFIFTLLARASGRIPEAYLSGSQILSDLITDINGVAFIIAFIAGMAGAISMATAKSGAVVGVAVSITTIPSAANIGVSLAMGNPAGSVSSLAMLILNVFGLVTAEVMTFVIASRTARRSARRRAPPVRPASAPDLAAARED
jgi:uncharacterized hydrophobic protein (TIGR00271 family)